MYEEREREREIEKKVLPYESLIFAACSILFRFLPEYAWCFSLSSSNLDSVLMQ